MSLGDDECDHRLIQFLLVKLNFAVAINLINQHTGKRFFIITNQKRQPGRPLFLMNAMTVFIYR
ncbi:Uncharacterised protein [Salmonella enterica subsp. enterica]|uniref:Uncharacterized protein n=1 Tax=Salmonella enterica I TaxID=59201 RepID=A0A447PKF1_SALET|nr:Uncharacterised protein [Salmonella enterica subsp. enterica]